MVSATRQRAANPNRLAQNQKKFEKQPQIIESLTENRDLADLPDLGYAIQALEDHDIDVDEFVSAFESYENPLLNYFETAFNAWGIDLGDLDMDTAQRLDSIVRLGSLRLSEKMETKELADLCLPVIDSRQIFYKDVLGLPQTKIDALQKTGYKIAPPIITALRSIQHIEENGFSSLRFVKKEVRVLSRLIDIPDTKQGLTKGGLNKTQSIKVIKSNPAVVFRKSQSLTDKLVFISDLGLPLSTVVRHPDTLNSSNETIGSNVAFFDIRSSNTTEGLTKGPIYITISKRRRESAANIADYFEINEVPVDIFEIVRLRLSIDLEELQAKEDIFNSRGYNGKLILSRHITLLKVEDRLIESNLRKLEHYIKFAGFNEQDLESFILKNVRLLHSKRERIRFIARSIHSLNKIIEIPTLDELSKTVATISTRNFKIVARLAISGPEADKNISKIFFQANQTSKIRQCVNEEEYAASHQMLRQASKISRNL